MYVNKKVEIGTYFPLPQHCLQTVFNELLQSKLQTMGPRTIHMSSLAKLEARRSHLQHLDPRLVMALCLQVKAAARCVWRQKVNYALKANQTEREETQGPTRVAGIARRSGCYPCRVGWHLQWLSH